MCPFHENKSRKSSLLLLFFFFFSSDMQRNQEKETSGWGSRWRREKSEGETFSYREREKEERESEGRRESDRTRFSVLSSSLVPVTRRFFPGHFLSTAIVSLLGCSLITLTLILFLSFLSLSLCICLIFFNDPFLPSERERERESSLTPFSPFGQIRFFVLSSNENLPFILSWIFPLFIFFSLSEQYYISRTSLS